MNVVERLEKMITATGSTYIKASELKKYVSYKEIAKCVNNKSIVRKYLNGNTYYSLPYIQKMEKSIARNVVAHVYESNILPDLAEDEINCLIDKFEQEQSALMGFEFKLHFEQRNAVHMAVNSHMCIITGGPGTGKTSVINAIRYVENNRCKGYIPSILFTAPTGKAARRITESVGVPSKTVQKQIGANEYKDTPYLVTADIMIIDEVSMLDTVTMYQLMRAVVNKLKLILVGDVDQLPSVGFGAILRDLIDSRVIPVTKLEKTFRQGAETGLAKNIALLKKGNSSLISGDDFKIFTNFEEDNLVETLINDVIQARSVYGDMGVILLTPYRRKGSTCANVMNLLLQEALNKSSKEIKTTIIDEDDEGQPYELKVRFRKNDPVMQLKNRDDCPIANGDVGYIVDIYPNNSMVVNFGHYEKIYRYHELKELNLAYAMSVHKSQGSEYPCVLTCVLPEHHQLLNRNMVYTAVTRAKKEIRIYYDKKSLSYALDVEGGYIRDTFLCEEIQYQNKKYVLIQSAS